MTRDEFLHTLKAALHGLPQAAIEQTVAGYARRFDDGMAAGRGEDEIARALGDPFQIAQALRSPSAPAGRRGAARAVRVFVRSLGLLALDACMAVPALIYSFVLLMFYAVAIACYVGGIALTAGSLSGVNAFSFSMPSDHVRIAADAAPGEPAASHPGRVRVEVGDHGLHVGEGGRAADDPAVNARHDGAAAEDRAGLRALKVLQGAGIILGGILLLLLSAAVTRYTWLGMKRYVRMHIALLRAA